MALTATSIPAFSTCCEGCYYLARFSGPGDVFPSYLSCRHPEWRVGEPNLFVSMSQMYRNCPIERIKGEPHALRRYLRPPDY